MSNHEDTCDDREELNPTSEVGSHGPRVQNMSSDSDRKWMEILEQQNKNFLALLEAMKSPTMSTNIVLPKYDPGRNDVDARAWISTADMCIGDRPLEGTSLMIPLTKALKGDASVWLSQISFHGMTWADFKELFIARYDCPETLAAHLVNLNAKKPKDNECLATYAATMIASLISRWNDLSKEQIAVGTVMAHLCQFESRVQRLAFTTNIDTKSQMLKEGIKGSVIFEETLY